MNILLIFNLFFLRLSILLTARYGDFLPIELNSTLAVMRLSIPGNDICGDCPQGLQVLGKCFTSSCANATTVDFVHDTILDLIETANPVKVPAGGTLTLLHVNRFCSATIIVLFECIYLTLYWIGPIELIRSGFISFTLQDINAYANTKEVVSVIQNLPYSSNSQASSLVLFSTAQTKCPPGRMGAACNYFCELGWQKMSPSDGKGGYLHLIDSGSKDPGNVYL